MDDRPDELERANVDHRILQMIAEQPTVEEQQEALQVWDQAVYFEWWKRRLEGRTPGEDHLSGHNSSEPTRPPTGTIPQE